MLFQLFRLGLPVSYTLIILLAYLFVLLTSFSAHEFSHALTAYIHGDLTAKAEGRLSLNPFAHFDTVGFICLIVFGFGWAKPVPINPMYFTKGKKSMFAVSIAGITANLILAIFYSLIFSIVGTCAPVFLMESTTLASSFVFYLLTFGIQINLSLAIFNLVPLYPLDGSKILELMLGADNKFINFLRNYSTIILLILVITDIMSILLGYAVGFLSQGLITMWTSLFGLFGK